MSPYSAFGNSPIIIRDPDGKDLYVGGKMDLSLKDLQSLVPEKYRSQIQVVDNKVIFDGFNELPDDVQKFEGVGLLNKMITSERKYKYSVSDNVAASNRKTGQKYNINLNVNDPSPFNAVLNLSKTIRTDLPEESVGNSLPEEGYDGSVTIRDGTFGRFNRSSSSGKYPTPRNNMVFHELRENFNRTQGEKGAGMDYKPAHKEASDRANDFSKEVNGKKDAFGGEAEYFSPGTGTGSSQSTNKK